MTDNNSGRADGLFSAEPATLVVGGRSVRYLRVGEGQGVPVVLLPGFGGDMKSFVLNQGPLSERRTVLALELPGQGESANDVGRGDVPFFVETLASFLDASGVSRAHLAGHSLGGLVAGAFALARPHSVASLTLFAGAGLGEQISTAFVEGFIAATTPEEMRAVLELLFANPRLVTRRLVEDVLRQKLAGGRVQALRTIAGQVYPGGRQGMILDLTPLSVSLLAIWGSADRIVPPAHATHLPAASRIEIIDGVGHLPQIEAADRVNQLVSAFLDAADAAA
jgi:pyruvate dehydrogenase E2 component (dihydrolipoamide acetyltransferase)